jgi:hypothetical protein
MPYNEYGDWIDELEEMDKAFKLLAEDQEIDEDSLRDSPKIQILMKDFVLDTGVTWDDLVEACDEKFGTLEERIEELEREKAFVKRINKLLKDGLSEEAFDMIRNGDPNNED